MKNLNDYRDDYSEFAESVTTGCLKIVFIMGFIVAAIAVLGAMFYYY